MRAQMLRHMPMRMCMHRTEVIMKKMSIIALLLLVFTAIAPAQEAPATQAEPAADQDFELGRIYFPRDFIHAGKDYTRGAYTVTLTEKDGFPWFKVFSKEKELLFEEMAVVKLSKTRRNIRRFRVSKNVLGGYEYFRIAVKKPEGRVMAFFLLKKSGTAEKPKKETAGPELSTF